MGLEQRPLPERLAVFVELEARLLEVPHHPNGELAPGIVGGVLSRR